MVRKKLKKVHTAGIVAMVVSIAGALIEAIPLIQGQVPPKYGLVLTLAGIVLQGLTKGVQHGSTDLVPKAPKSPPESPE